MTFYAEGFILVRPIIWHKIYRPPLDVNRTSNTANSGKFPLSTRGKLFYSYLYHLRQVYYGKARYTGVVSVYTNGV